MKKRFETVGVWMLDHEKQILYAIGFGIAVLLSFVFGVLKGSAFSQHPMTVYRPVNAPLVLEKESQNDGIETMRSQDCIYVGSVKGTKYYPPSCSYAKKIVKENLRCFVSDQDAQEKGYTRSLSCK